MLHRRGLLFCSITMFALSGCGEAEDANLPPLAQATGTVQLDGKPLSGATVIFLPTGDNQGTGASGFTDADGKFTLQTLHRGEGAAVGDFRVTISRFVMPDGSVYPLDSEQGPDDVGAVEQLAPQYSDAARSQLKAKVPAEGTTFSFDLKSKR